MGEPHGAPNDFDRFVFAGLSDAYTQQPPATLAEISALLESFKKRLIVSTARVAEFEAAVRDAGLDHAVTVVGHAWLEPDQVYLATSEAQLEADMRASIEAGRAEMLADLDEQAAAWAARMREKWEAEWEAGRVYRQSGPLPSWSPLTGPTGI